MSRQNMIAMDYATGEEIGHVEVSEADYEALAQWPEGIIEASAILDDEDLSRYQIEDKQVIFLIEEA